MTEEIVPAVLKAISKALSEEAKAAPRPPMTGGKAPYDPFRTIGKWQIFNTVSSGITAALPTWTHGIQVSVAGGPKSSIKRLWYLCLSAAFGRYRERVQNVIAGCTMNAQWDITNKVVSVELVYSSNGWGTIANSVLAKSALTGNINLPSGSPLGRLARGPEQLTVGGSWPIDFLPTSTSNPAQWTNTVTAPKWVVPAPCPNGTFQSLPTIPYTGIGGARNIGTGQESSGSSITPPVPNPLVEYPTFFVNFQVAGYASASEYVWQGFGPLAAGGLTWPVQGLDSGIVVSNAPDVMKLPTLPDDGRIITTSEQNDPMTQPPRPIIDGHTRSSLLMLVAQGLNVPCFLPFSAPCTTTPLASSGRYLWNPGSDVGTDANQQGLISNASGTDLTPGQPNVGPDGYATQPTGLPQAQAGSAPNVGEGT